MNEIQNLNLNRGSKGLLASFIMSAAVGGLVGGLFGYLVSSFKFIGVDAAVLARRQINAEAGLAMTTEESLVVSVVKKANPSVVSIAILGTTNSEDISKNIETTPDDAAQKESQSQRSQETRREEDFKNKIIANTCQDPILKLALGKQCSEAEFQTPSKQITRQAPGKQADELTSVGSGFIASPDGLIVTNKHVIDAGKGELFAITEDGVKHKIKVLSRDPDKDLAIIKIDGSNLPFLTLGDSDKLENGRTVIAIGNALGKFANTVSRGVISNLSRSVAVGNANGKQLARLDKLIQTDVAINSGSSGGPLLNLQGEVIGINTAIVDGAKNISLAIPANQVKLALEQAQSGLLNNK
ncbi:MAG: trypsin-like peptidase domain-containing protein [Candidatus Yanofskybacteria bacterium]|nr:trypsin-like peptidase domain-containing protein [Candidatus Yanofskybacteria bacterium]